MNDIKRRALIERLLEQFQAGTTASERDIKRAVTLDEWRKYEDQVREHRIPPPDRFAASEFRSYVERLRQADLLNGRAEALHSRRPNARLEVADCVGLYQWKPLWMRAEIAYGHALEALEELLSDNPGLVSSLDRPVDFSHEGGTCSLCPEGVPRLITSRSPTALCNGRPRQTKLGLKCAILWESLDNLDTQVGPTNQRANDAWATRPRCLGGVAAGFAHPDEREGMAVDDSAPDELGPDDCGIDDFDLQGW